MLNRKRRSNRGNLAEWPAAIFICLFFFVFPMINLVALGADCSVIAMITLQAAVRASSQQDYSVALAGAKQEISGLNSGPFAKFAQLTPVGGYENSGLKLYIDATNYYDNQSAQYGPNTPLPASVDLTKNIFEYRAVSDYQVKPFISLASVPFVQDVPGLGKPTNLHFEMRRAVEHIQGLQNGSARGTFSGGSTTLDLGSLNGINVPGVLEDGSGSGWNYPNIYAMIQAAGEQVVEQNVVIVAANNPNWTPTGLQISPGCQVWIDTHASGAWSFLTNGGSQPLYNANGDSSLLNQTGFPTGALLGDAGNQMFMLGVSKLNYPPPATGPLGLAMNDDAGPGANRAGYTGNVGEQAVRVIVTR